MIDYDNFDEKQISKYNFPDEETADLYETIITHGEDDLFNDILYAESPTLSHEHDELRKSIEKASRVFEEKIEKTLEPIKAHLYSHNPREQWESFHDLLRLYSARYFADTHQSAHVARKILQKFITEIDTQQGAYYYQRYFKSFLNEKNPTKRTREELLLKNGDVLIVSESADFIISSEAYAQITDLQDQIRTYDEKKNPTEWLTEKHTRKNGSVSTVEYIKPDPHNDDIDNHIETLQKKIFNIKKEFAKNSITPDQLNLAGESIDDHDIKDYVDIMTSTLQNDIEQDFGISLDEMSLDLQMQFIKYIKRADQEKIQRLQDAGNTHANNFYTSFLSLAHGGPQMGDKILEIAEKLPENVAKEIFNKYAEIVHINENIIDFLQQHYHGDIDRNPALIEDIRTKLFIKGSEILNDFHAKIPDQELTSNEIHEDIMSELSTLQAETFAKLSTFKYARKHGASYELSDIQNAELSIYTPQQLVDQGYHERMRVIYEANWKNKYPPEVYAQLESIFMESFDGTPQSEQDNRFYVFTLEENLESFVRFEKKEDGILYASALNVDPHKHGFSLGEAVMAQSLAQEAQKNILSAKAIPTDAHSARYIEMGFVGHALENFENIDVVNIAWNTEKNKNLISKQLSPLEIAQMAHNDIPTPDTLRVYKAQSQEDFDFLNDEAYALTRYFRNKDGWYCVYEYVDIDDYISPEPHHNSD